MFNQETQPNHPDYVRQHEQAIQKGEHWYIDAKTGFMVFTELYHRERGTCCLSACRHCPWGFKR